ncbi:MAG: YIP1 family protein [Opitutaceae bacterium]|nr:YIP1 family protein [Verrucomicrobiales bacterium]
MPIATSNTSLKPATPSSIGGKLLNVIATPGDLFDEIVATPSNRETWLVPTLLVCLTGLLLLPVATAKETAARATDPVLAFQAERLFGNWRMFSAVATCAAVFVGTFWSAFVLWFIGRVFLKVRFSYWKSLEVVGLAGIILALGSIVTLLLILASGQSTARPALSLFANGPEVGGKIHTLLDLMNCFHLWTTAVLAVGLGKLSGVSLKESAFWVFGYWVLLRAMLLMLT